jgi:hypothetical protein
MAGMMAAATADAMTVGEVVMVPVATAPLVVVVAWLGQGRRREGHGSGRYGCSELLSMVWQLARTIMTSRAEARYPG